jgi:hypothetical protein
MDFARRLHHPSASRRDASPRQDGHLEGDDILLVRPIATRMPAQRSAWRRMTCGARRGSAAGSGRPWAAARRSTRASREADGRRRSKGTRGCASAPTSCGRSGTARRSPLEARHGRGREAVHAADAAAAAPRRRAQRRGGILAWPGRTLLSRLPVPVTACTCHRRVPGAASPCASGRPSVGTGTSWTSVRASVMATAWTAGGIRPPTRASMTARSPWSRRDETIAREWSVEALEPETAIDLGQRPETFRFGRCAELREPANAGANGASDRARSRAGIASRAPPTASRCTP